MNLLDAELFSSAFVPFLLVSPPSVDPDGTPFVRSFRRGETSFFSVVFPSSGLSVDKLIRFFGPSFFLLRSLRGQDELKSPPTPNAPPPPPPLFAAFALSRPPLRPRIFPLRLLFFFFFFVSRRPLKGFSPKSTTPSLLFTLFSSFCRRLLLPRRD